MTAGGEIAFFRTTTLVLTGVAAMVWKRSRSSRLCIRQRFVMMLKYQHTVVHLVPVGVDPPIQPR